jgi:hypothetical protein
VHENLDRGEKNSMFSDRSFGIVLALMLLGIGIWEELNSFSAARYSLLGLIFVFTIAIIPTSILASPSWVWMKLGLLGRVGNLILFRLVFFLILAPMGVVRSLLSKDTLYLKFQSDLESDWIDRNPPGPKPGYMTKQY